MKQIYLDNAATSFPKPNEVADSVYHYMTEIGSNISRGGYDLAYDTADVVLQTRNLLCELFYFGNSSHVIFTYNITMALNMVLKGLLTEGCHVLTSSIEHNAMMRPLVQLQECGVCFSRIPADATGKMDLDALGDLLQPNTRMLAVTHASNVCGTINPLKELGSFCKEHDLLFVVDSAQTAGLLPIDMQQLNIDVLTFTGHKGLLGPQGIGGFLIREDAAQQMQPLLSGGSGSFSDLETIPPRLPDKFEAGTPNLPGIFGLHAALLFLKEKDISSILKHEQALVRMLDDGLREIPSLRIVGDADATKRVSAFSVDFLEKDNAEIAYQLQQHGILTRCGLHCAPHAHKTLGTYPQGTVRFSPGYFNTEQDIAFTIEQIKKLV